MPMLKICFAFLTTVIVLQTSLFSMNVTPYDHLMEYAEFSIQDHHHDNIDDSHVHRHKHSEDGAEHDHDHKHEYVKNEVKISSHHMLKIKCDVDDRGNHCFFYQGHYSTVYLDRIDRPPIV